MLVSVVFGGVGVGDRLASLPGWFHGVSAFAPFAGGVVRLSVSVVVRRRG